MISLALWRFLRRTPWSTSMALLGIALGVTSIVSVHLISAAVASQLEQLIPGELGVYSHFLHREAVDASDYFELRRRWLGADADIGFDEVQALAPVIDETMSLDGQAVRLIGLDLLDAASLRRLATDSAEVESFSWQGVWVDAGVSATADLEINGYLEGASGVVLADIGVAQRLLGWDDDRISYIGVDLRDPWARTKTYGERLLPGFSAGLPGSAQELPVFKDFTVLSLAQQHPATQFGKAVLFNISALGLLAMLVAWFLIYQVAVSWLRRLWGVFERLHVLGVEWSQLAAYFVAAMCVLGLIACAVGLWAGLWLAQALFGWVTGQVAEGFALTGWVAGKALLSAVGVCLLGGLWAFRQARRSDLRPPRWLGAAVLLAVALVGMHWSASGLLGGFLSIAIFSVLAVMFAAPLLNYLRRFAAAIRGPYLVRWSAREAVWYPQDLSVALAGLTLAVATAIGVGLMVDSFREDFSRMLERRLSYDLVLRGDDADLQAAAARAAQTATVSRIQRYAEMDVRVLGAPLQVVATHLDAQESARYGLARSPVVDEVLLSEQAARLLGRQPGDEVAVNGHALHIAAIFSSFGDVQPRLLLQRDHPLALQMRRLRSVSINSSEPSALAEELLRAHPNLSVSLQSELRRTALSTFDQTFIITTVLIFIAMIVAALGVYVAVTTLRLNRRSSGQLMTGLGLDRIEDIGMDFALGMGVGVVALILAVPLGTVFGWILCAVINPRAFGWSVELQLQWSSYAAPVIWGLVAAAGAGLLRVGRTEAGGMRHAG